MTHLFPYALTVLDLCGAATYALRGDGWRAVYWVAAALLTYSTTRIGGAQ